MAEEWIAAAKAAEIDDEDLVTVEIADRLIAIYNLDGNFYATSGVCTHEAEPLTDGMVIDGIIECPFHQGRFCVKSGKAQGAPVSTDLTTYPVRVEDGEVFVALGRESGGS